MEVSITVNGSTHSRDVEPRTLLVHHLRDNLGLTGTNVGCDSSSCGACTIHMNGESVKSCTVLAVQADGQELTTIEGLSAVAEAEGISTGDQNWHPMQEAFQQCHALQCGYCTPGMITRAHRLLEENPNPTEEDVRFGIAGNLCRCTGYQNIVKAVLAAADELNQPEAVA